MNAVVVCPFFFCYDAVRADITRHVFAHYATMTNITFIGVGSEGDLSREMFAEHFPDQNYREFPQYWSGESLGPTGSAGLRRKFNAAVAAAREYEPDVVFLVGSDDMVPEAFFTPTDEEIVGLGQGADGGAHFWPYGLDVSYWWYGSSRSAAKTRLAGGVLGFSIDLLDKFGWEPFQFPGDEVGVENYVRNSTGAVEERFGMPAWHPKGKRVLNDMHNIHSHLTLISDDPLLTAEFLDYWHALVPPSHES